MTYTKLLKLCLASLPVVYMIYHYNCYNVSQQPAVDEVSNIIFSRSSISVLVAGPPRGRQGGNDLWTLGGPLK